MTHQSSEVIVSLLEPFTDPIQYPGVREHFTARQLARLDALAEQTSFDLNDKAFLIAMISKLLLTAD